VKVAQDLLELVKAFSRLVREEALADFVPVFLRDLALLTALLYLFQPCVYRRVFLRVSEETWGIRPGAEDGLKVIFFEFECVEHSEMIGGSV
jgi:hypothetical protein